MSLLVAARSKAWVCGRSPADTVGSNHTGGMDVCLLWVLSGRGLCDELITHPGNSYRLWCVVVCEIETSWMRRPWLNRCCRAKIKKVNNYIFVVYIYVTWAVKLPKGLLQTMASYMMTPCSPVDTLYLQILSDICWNIIMGQQVLPITRSLGLRN
jgi:hypothetical protein